MEVLIDSIEIIQHLEDHYDPFDWIRRVVPKGSQAAQAAYMTAIDRHVITRMLPMIVPNARNIFPVGPDRDAFVAGMEKKLGRSMKIPSYDMLGKSS